MGKYIAIVFFFLTAQRCVCDAANNGISIAVVTSDKSQTRLRLIRDSPRLLVKRLNSYHKGTKSEDLARVPVGKHQWFALDFDYRRREYFVLDGKNSSLLVVTDDKGHMNKIQLLYQGLSPKVKAIAYDWLRRSLYWGDPAYRSIFRLDIGHLCKDRSCNNYLSWEPIGRLQRLYPRSARSKRSKRGVLTSIIGDGLVYPSAIAVDPIKAKLYWADDATLASIQSSTLDGKDRSLVVGGLVRPSGIALDYDTNTLFWLERLSGLSVIKSCELKHRLCFPKQLSSVSNSRLFDMDFHQGFLIASDLSHRRLIIYDTANDQTLRQKWAGTTYGICVAAKSKQPWSELVASEPRAPDQQPLIISDIQQHGALFLSSVTTGIWVTAKTFAMGGGQAPFIQYIKASGVTTMALDVGRTRLFYFSKRTKSIYRVTLHHHLKPDQKTYPLRIVSGWLDTVTALAVDWATGNLYWADRGYHRIMVADSLGNFATVLHSSNITDPQDLVIHSEKRLLFWTDMDPSDPRVERSDLDGYNRVVILRGNIFYERPLALAIDYDRDVLYWSDGPYLCSSTLSGTFTGSCKSRDYTSSAVVKAMDMMHDFVVWTDFLGGVKLNDMNPEMSSFHREFKAYHSEHVFSDILYFHSSRQMKLTDPCTTPAHEYSKHSRPSPEIVNSFIYDSVSSSYIASSTTPASAPTPISSNTTISPPSGAISRPFSLLGKGITCEHLCLQSRSSTQCACATGYWLKADGNCSSGEVVDEILFFADIKVGSLFRQFTLLPDYYAFPVRGSRRVVDVAICTVEKRVYWLDAARNAIHSAFVNGTKQSVVLASTTDFNMTQIVLAPRSRLLYILTSSGEVAVFSLRTKIQVNIISDPRWAILDAVVDETRRELYMTASWKRVFTSSTRSVNLNYGLVLRAKMDGSDLQIVHGGDGQPWCITLHDSYLLWTDIDRHGIFMAYLGEVGEFDPAKLNSDSVSVTQLLQLPDRSSPNDIVVVGNDIYFTDRTKQAIQRIKLNHTGEVEAIGLTTLNDITGLAYFNASLQEEALTAPTACAGIAIPQYEDSWTCLCSYHTEIVSGQRQYCQDTMAALMHKMSSTHGLCYIAPPAHGSVRGGYLNTYVLPGQEIEVSCDPGYLIASKHTRTEKRTCKPSGGWSSERLCESDIHYTIKGNDSRGYVILTTSTKFVVPLNIQRLDVIAIGGGGGGFDACNRTMFKNRHRAGMGVTSSFGNYLRANGGQGGSRREGGLGGKARNLFGGKGKSSADCLGGGAAGETTTSKQCQHGSTSCPFCGVGGILPSCSACLHRWGGCGAEGSVARVDPSAADSFGGGATGTFGGAGGGGGGFSRKTVRVSSQEIVPVTVGAAGTPSARPAGSGVVVVGWGARLEQLVEELSRKPPCKPFSRGMAKKCIA